MTAFVAAASALASATRAPRSTRVPPGAIVDISLADQVTALEQAIRPQAVALAAFAALAGLIALAVLGQLLSRQLALDAAEFPVLRAFGATRAQPWSRCRWPARRRHRHRRAARGRHRRRRLAADADRAGQARRAGARASRSTSPCSAPGLAAIALLPLAVLAPAALAGRGRAAGAPGVRRPGARGGGRPSRLAALLSRAGSVPGGIGVRMAFEPGRGRTAVPVRSALAGSVIAVAAVVAAGVFGASLVGLVGTPRAYGQNWDAVTDLGFGGVPPAAGGQGDRRQAGESPSTPPATTARSPSAAGASPRSASTQRAARLPHAAGRPRAARRRARSRSARRPCTTWACGSGRSSRSRANHETTATADKTTVMRVVGVVVLPRFARGTFAPTGLGTGRGGDRERAVRAQPVERLRRAAAATTSSCSATARAPTWRPQDARADRDAAGQRLPDRLLRHHRRPAPGRDQELRERP